MSEVILDPDDPSLAFIGSAAVGEFGQQVGVATLTNVHRATRCAGRPCVIHHPSEHHMRAWPLNWRDDTGVMERVCPHRIGHPDPDALAHLASVGAGWAGVHGCDGCCRGDSGHGDRRDGDGVAGDVGRGVAGDDHPGR